MKEGLNTYRDARIVLGRISWNGGEVRAVRALCSTSGNDELSTLGVELWSVCLVEGEQLMSDQVVARSQRGWNGAGPRQLRVNDGGSPVCACKRRSSHAHLVDLEPALARSGAGRESAGALVHPHHEIG